MIRKRDEFLGGSKKQLELGFRIRLAGFHFLPYEAVLPDVCLIATLHKNY